MASTGSIFHFASGGRGRLNRPSSPPSRAACLCDFAFFSFIYPPTSKHRLVGRRPMRCGLCSRDFLCGRHELLTSEQARVFSAVSAPEVMNTAPSTASYGTRGPEERGDSASAAPKSSRREPGRSRLPARPAEEFPLSPTHRPRSTASSAGERKGGTLFSRVSAHETQAAHGGAAAGLAHLAGHTQRCGERCSAPGGVPRQGDP